jgi:hypothetical protein
MLVVQAIIAIMIMPACFVVGGLFYQPTSSIGPYLQFDSGMLPAPVVNWFQAC